MSRLTPAIAARRCRTAKRVCIVLAAIMFVVMEVLGAMSYNNAKFIMSDYTEVDATVTEKEHTTERGRRGRKKQMYRVSYAFMTPDGQQMNDTFTTNKDRFYGLSEGGPISIVYSNLDPSKFGRRYLIERQASLSGLIQRSFPVAGFIAFLFAVFYFVVRAKIMQALRAAQAAGPPV